METSSSKMGSVGVWADNDTCGLLLHSPTMEAKVKRQSCEEPVGFVGNDRRRHLSSRITTGVSTFTIMVLDRESAARWPPLDRARSPLAQRH